MPGTESAPSDLESNEKRGAPEQEQGQETRASSRDDAPDGGLRAWLVVLGVWCSWFCSFGWINSIGIFQEYYQSTLLVGYSAGTIAWIPSLEVFFMMGMGPVIGHLYDRYGPRVLVLGGTFLHVFGLMMASLSTEYYQLLLSQGICSAVGASAIFQCSLNSLHGWFDKKSGAVFGISATGSSIGGIVFPIMTSRLIRSVGFPWAMRACAFLILFLLIIANFTIASRHPPQPQRLNPKKLLRPFGEPNFMLVTVGIFLFTFGMFAPINYLPAQAASVRIDATVVQYLVAILNAGSLFGRLGSGFLGDKIGRYNIFVFVCYAAGLLTLAMWIPVSSTGGIAAFSALFGFFSGAYVSLLAILIAQISPPAEIGFRTGIVFSLSGIAGLVTSPICGAILDGTSGGGGGGGENWTGVKIFAGVFCLAGTSCVFLARLRITKWNLATVF